MNMAGFDWFAAGVCTTLFVESIVRGHDIWAVVALGMIAGGMSGLAVFKNTRP